MISGKSSRGKIKTCGIHDMLRDLCLKKAQEEKFFHVRDKDNIFPESIKYSRRLCIHPDILHEEFKCYQSMGSLPAVRSILIYGVPSISYSEGPKGIDESQINELVDGKLFPLLRVLDLKQYKQINELKAEVIANLESNDDKLQIRGCSELWLVFVYISEGFISEGIGPRLLEFLDRIDYPKLQLAAARAIADISHRSSNNIHLIEQGAVVPTMVSLVSSPTDEHRREALEVLATIADVSAESRDLVLSHGVLMPLLEQFTDKTKPTILRQATELLSVLCMRKPRFEQVKSAILPLAHLIHSDDPRIFRPACMALFYLTCGEMDMKQAVIDAGVIPRFFELLLYRDTYISSPAVCTVGNIISYVDDTQIQAVIEAGIISPLLPMLQDAQLFKAVAEVIYNVTTKGTNAQIKFLVHEGCIEPMYDLLVNPNEVHVIKICLEGLENILKVGEAEKNQGNTEDVNVFAQMIVDAGGIEKIKNLQTHDNSKIREQIRKILETYW
ncbi:unnamed protein product [Fraxinus pennsylvanica]|uniref:Uncharacterized protein n=1 Tax=Fraxinus pennsylvanica TaxID=56036 RepID=A0AAD2E6Y7_9LAMI|nr:unnamed protein product [Fraxinus pennsylvanica]